MTANPPAGWYPDPQGANRTRYWDGAAWASQSAEVDPFASPAAPPEPRLPYNAPQVMKSAPQRSQGLSTGGVVGIVVSILVAIIALIGALVALYFMTSSGQATSNSDSSEATASQSALESSDDAAPTGVAQADDTSLPFAVEEVEVGTRWMLRYDVGTLDVPSSARDVTRSAIERLKGDTSYIGGVWSLDGLSWTATESYLYAEVWSYDSAPVQTLEEVADAYYASYYEDLGFDVTPIALETHPLGYEMASFEVTGFDDAFLGTGESIPVRHSIVLLRGGQQEVALSLFRLGAKDDNVVMQWDGEFDTAVQSFRFWEDTDK